MRVSSLQLVAVPGTIFVSSSVTLLASPHPLDALTSFAPILLVCTRESFVCVHAYVLVVRVVVVVDMYVWRGGCTCVHVCMCAVVLCMCV